MSSGLNWPGEGWLMCAVCLDPFRIEKAWKDENGQAWDVCSPQCAAKSVVHSD